MEDKFIDELTRVIVMKGIRKDIHKYFRSWVKWKDSRSTRPISKYTRSKRTKETNDIIASIHFFKDDVFDVFFPILRGNLAGKWIPVVKNKLSYLVANNYKSDNFKGEIKSIKRFYISRLDEWDNIRKGLLGKNINITVSMGKDNKYVMNNNIYNVQINISSKLYNKLYGSIRKNINGNKNMIIYLTMIRYEILLDSKNHQLAINYLKYNINKFDVELFASPINRTLKRFCSAYPDIDKYYKGNLGSFFKYKFTSDTKYTMNPPYIEQMMIDSVDHVIKEMNRSSIKNITILISLPIWDPKVLKSIAENEGSDDKYNYVFLKNIPEKYIPYEMLKGYKYTTEIKVYSMKSYSYYDHLREKLISVTNTFHITLKKG